MFLLYMQIHRWMPCYCLMNSQNLYDVTKYFCMLPLYKLTVCKRPQLISYKQYNEDNNLEKLSLLGQKYII